MAGETGGLSMDMAFDDDEIPMKKYIVTEKQVGDLQGAANPEFRRMVASTIRMRPVSVGHVSGLTCAACRQHKPAGYFICEDCHAEYHGGVGKRVLTTILNKMKTDLNFSETHAAESSGAAAVYYHARAACLEHYIETINALIKDENEVTK